MFQVYLNEDLLMEFKTLKESMVFIDEHMKNTGKEPYYLRLWCNDNVIHIDYGSHTTFYHIKNTEDKKDLDQDLEEYLHD